MIRHETRYTADTDIHRPASLELHRKLGMTRFANNAGIVLGKLDAGDLDGFFSHFHELATLRFGSRPPVQGRSAIVDHVRGFLSAVVSTRHRIHRQLAAGDLVIVFGDVAWRLAGGEDVVRPFCHTWRLSAGYTIVEYQIYSEPVLPG
jgi:hypothetical protein